MKPFESGGESICQNLEMNSCEAFWEWRRIHMLELGGELLCSLFGVGGESICQNLELKS